MKCLDVPIRPLDLTVYGLNNTGGMAVIADAFPETLAHEIGHACGLNDLYLYGVVPGPVSIDNVNALNWSGGEGTDITSRGFLTKK